MSDAQRERIAKLRRLAASTTFPAEKASATAKADRLEAELGDECRDDHGPDARKAPPQFSAVAEELRRAAQRQKVEDVLLRQAFDELIRRQAGMFR